MDPAQQFAANVISLPGTEVSPAALEAMGKRASLLHHDQGARLTEVVPQIIKEAEHPLSREQVQRVVEFANQQTHIGYLEKGAEYPSFEVADPSQVCSDVIGGDEVIQTDDFGAPPAEETLPAPEYHADESEHQKAAARLADAELEQMYFGLKGRADHVRADLDELDRHIKTAQRDFHHHTKRFLLDGGTMSDVASALGTLGGGEFAKQAMFDLTEWLQEQIPSALIAASFVKEAEARAPNPNHPMVGSFAALVSLSRDRFKGARFQSSLMKEASGIRKHLVQGGT